MRDMSRISYLLKNSENEMHYEEAAWLLYQDIHDFDFGAGESTAFGLTQLPKDGTRINMKVFKIIFNRAYRLKSSDTKVAKALMLWLEGRLSEMLEEEDTYYSTLLQFELVRIHTLEEDLATAE